MTVYRALDVIPSRIGLPEKPPSVPIALHLTIENFNKHGRGRKPARERIEAMLERDYQMQKNGNCDYRSEEHTSELQSLMRSSYAVFCLKKKKTSNAHSRSHKTKN